VQPERADFYPEDMSVAEFETWAKELGAAGAGGSEAAKAQAAAAEAEARGFYSVIRRGQGPAGRGLRAVPYSEEYRALLAPCAALLLEAAALTTFPSLAAFLRARAAAFESNKYSESEFKWMALDCPIEVTIGPYEVYADELMGLKATFEAFVTVRDERETAKLELFQGMLQELEDHLPMEEQYKVETDRSVTL
jgi:hypothetical protein